MDRVSSRDNAASIAKPGAAGATPLVQKSDFKGMDFAAGEAALKPREGAHGKPALPVQRKVFLQDTKTEHSKPTAKSTDALRDLLIQNHGAKQWKPGWISALREMVRDNTIHPFATVQALAQHLEALFPKRDVKATSAEATLLIEAHKASENLSIAGFLWKACSSGVKLQSGHVFDKAQVVAAMLAKDGREYVDGLWRDRSGSTRVDQHVQGQHEWILTSDLVYVIRSAKSEADLQLWFMAAEMLRTPTKNVLFPFQLSPQQKQLLASGKATLAQLGVVSAHAGGLFEPRPADDAKAANPKSANVQVAAHSATFHHQLAALLREYLSATENNFAGYLKALASFQQSEVWNGDLPLTAAAAAAPTGFVTGPNAAAKENAPSVGAMASNQKALSVQNAAIQANRAEALLSEVVRLKSPTAMAVDTSSLDAQRLQLVEATFKTLDSRIQVELERHKVHFQIATFFEKSDDKRKEAFAIWQAEWNATYASYIAQKNAIIAKAK